MKVKGKVREREIVERTERESEFVFPGLKDLDVEICGKKVGWRGTDPN